MFGVLVNGPDFLELKIFGTKEVKVVYIVSRPTEFRVRKKAVFLFAPLPLPKNKDRRQTVGAKFSPTGC